MAHSSRRTWLPALAALLLGASVLVALFLRPGGASSLTGQSARSTNPLYRGLESAADVTAAERARASRLGKPGARD